MSRLLCNKIVVGAKCGGVPAANDCWNEVQRYQGPAVEDCWWGYNPAGLCYIQVTTTVVVVVVVVVVVGW